LHFLLKEVIYNWPMNGHERGWRRWSLLGLGSKDICGKRTCEKGEGSHR